MTGQELKIKLSASGKTQKEIAELLGVTPQALTVIFKSKDVKSGTLEKLCVVLGKDMTFFYPTKPVLQTTSTFTRAEAHNLHTGNGDINENTAASSEDKDKIIKDLIEIIKAKEGL